MRFVKKKDKVGNTIFIDKDTIVSTEENESYIAVQFIDGGARAYLYKENKNTGRFKFSPANLDKDQQAWILKKTIENDMR